jgi:hypothetical protein
MGDYASAAILGHEALENTTDPLDRDRIVLNIGMTLANLGLRDEARDAYIVVSSTAQEATMRWLATINLMELAYLDRRELVFEQYRRSLCETDLPPYLQAVLHETLGHGARTFGRPDDAVVAFKRMRDIGERYGLNEYTLKADRALQEITNAVSKEQFSRARVDDQPAGVVAVAHAMTAMREESGLRE